MKNFFMTLALVAMVATSCSNDDASLVVHIYRFESY